jgi:hypothetical protein
MKSVRTHRSGSTARATLLTVLMTLFVVHPLARPASAVTLFGHDISWPQCSVADGGFGNPLPPTSTQFVVVGLTKGLAFTQNPCLDDQVAWVRAHAKPAHGYTMATFPTAAQLTTYRAAGPWAPTTRAAQLSNVGYAEARYAVATMAAVGWRPPMVWIDVEPRPAQPWPGVTGTALRENRYLIEGLMRGLRDAGFPYGVYSYAAGWTEIVGGWYLPTVPVWATAGRLDYPTEALDRCSQRSFSGGPVHIAQWYDSTRDYDRTCEPYAFRTPAIPPAIMTGSIHDWDADWSNDALRLDTEGTLWLYHGTGRSTLPTRTVMARSWTAVVDVIGPGDLTGDRLHDLLETDTSGRMFLYPGNGRGGLTPRTFIGTGWSPMRVITGNVDMNGDGRTDLLALDSSGRLWLYRGTDRSGFSPRTQVAAGWSAMTDVVGAGDLTSDGRADVVALDTSGRLWLYPGTGTGLLGTRRQLASGWTGLRLTGPGDVSGDRVPDLLALDPAGTLSLYPGTTSGALGPRQVVGTGWTGVRALG